MTRKISLFILLFSVLKVAVSQFGCSINEYFSVDVNPCNSCEIRGWCPQGFGPGCDCYPGYFRNSFGICVPAEVCDGLYNFPIGKEVPSKVPYEPSSISPRYHRYGPPPPSPPPPPPPPPRYPPAVRPYHPGAIPRPPPVLPPRPPLRPVVPHNPPTDYLPVAVPKPPPPPVLPPPPLPPKPSPRPPTGSRGCPNRVACNRHCKSSGFSVGFCVDNHFLKCNCMG